MNAESEMGWNKFTGKLMGEFIGKFIRKGVVLYRIRVYTLCMNYQNEYSPHYTVRIENHRTQERLEVELIDTPFASRSFELRVNGSRPLQMTYATKTQMWDRLRKWMVQHD